MKNAYLSLFLMVALCLMSCQTSQPSAETREDNCGLRDPAAAGNVCSQIFGDKEIAPLLTSPEALVLYHDTNVNMVWDKWLESDIDYMTFFSKNTFERGKKTQHPSEIYGFENYKAFVEAREYLNKITVGNFRINRDVILKTHDMGAEGIKKQSWLMGKLLPKNMSTGNSTGFKARTNVGGDALIHPLSETQFQALKSNPWISSFKELPWPLSGPDRRRGLIVYGDYRKMDAAIADLESWYFRSKNTMDPIELAAEFQYRFVSLHPFVDGNGRTSMLLANRILREFGYPGIIQNFPGFDIYYSVKDWADVIRSGVAEYAEMIKDIPFQAAPNINEVNGRGTARTSLLPAYGQGRNVSDKLANKYKWTDRYVDTEHGLVKIGDQQFAFLSDGFFYDFHGIPYALHENKLYPVSDRTYLLYAENGKLTDRRFSRRSISPAHRDIFKTHFKFFRNLETGEIKAREIEVVPYKTIEEANNKGDIFLFPWQVSAFTNAITIKDTDPYAILAHTRGVQTQFDALFDRKGGINVSEVVAQYQYLEMKYQRYMEFAEKMGNPEWKELIMQSRTLYFNAAKTLLDDGIRRLQKMPDYEGKIVRESSRWSFMMKYVEQTNLAYPNLKEAIAARGDKNIILIRSDMATAGYMGFVSNQTYIEVAKMIPGYDKFKIWVKKYVEADSTEKEAIEKSAITQNLKKIIPGFENLIGRVHAAINENRYDSRGISDPFNREFVDHHLHAWNSAIKDHISLSTSPDLYFNYMGNGQDKSGPFIAEGVEAKIFFVKMEKSKVAATIATPFYNEYEILAQKYVGPQHIVGNVTLDFFKVESVERFYEINKLVELVNKPPRAP